MDCVRVVHNHWPGPNTFIFVRLFGKCRCQIAGRRYVMVLIHYHRHRIERLNFLANFLLSSSSSSFALMNLSTFYVIELMRM